MAELGIGRHVIVLVLIGQFGLQIVQLSRFVRTFARAGESESAGDTRP